MLFTEAKSWVKKYALKRGMLIRRIPPGRHGDALADQASLLSHGPVHYVVDVGAYIGTTARKYHDLFSDAQIHCFEPVASSFAELQRTAAGVPQIIANRAAISDEPGTLQIVVNRFTATSSRLEATADSARMTGHDWLDAIATETVTATTLDRYCAEREIDQIDILKLDIQGGEAAALKGASAMLSRGAIHLVYIEVLLRQLYAGQPLASELLLLLEKHGYRIYGIYDQAYAGDTSLYQIDALFMSPQLQRALNISVAQPAHHR